ncbi:MAG: hypothetical protein QXI58_00335 [Candidatus Micrarchaeia archaeon]|jgi:hypothetical protein
MEITREELKGKVCVNCEIDFERLNEFLWYLDGYTSFDKQFLVEHPDINLIKNSSIEELPLILAKYGSYSIHIVDNFVKTGKHRRYLKKILSKMVYSNNDENEL